MRDLNAIKKIVTKSLAKDFGRHRIIDVRIHEDRDADGDEILRIEVVFEGAPGDLDAKKLAGAVRQLRPKLEEINVQAFPLLSFVSRADMEQRKIAS